MITIDDYWMGRDETHAVELSTNVRANALLMVELVNKFMVLGKVAGVRFEDNPATGSPVSSGWRPPAINSAVPNAAPRSKHMTGQACDLYDPEGDIDDWAMSDPGQRVLTDLGLWLEHPAATKGWCHIQSVPTGSKRRVFYP